MTYIKRYCKFCEKVTNIAKHETSCTGHYCTECNATNYSSNKKDYIK